MTLLRGLEDLAADQPGTGVVRGTAGAIDKTAFVFPGQGSQALGMGRELHACYPAFAEAFDAAGTELDRHLLRPIRDVMWGANEALLDSTEFAQPALQRRASHTIAVMRRRPTALVIPIAPWLAGATLGLLACRPSDSDERVERVATRVDDHDLRIAGIERRGAVDTAAVAAALLAGGKDAGLSGPAGPPGPPGPPSHRSPRCCASRDAGCTGSRCRTRSTPR